MRFFSTTRLVLLSSLRLYRDVSLSVIRGFSRILFEPRSSRLTPLLGKPCLNAQTKREIKGAAGRARARARSLSESKRRKDEEKESWSERTS